MHSYRSTQGTLALLAGLILHAAAPAQNPPPGFTYETLVDGPLEQATAMAFLPDGRLLITERETGNIRQYRDGALDAAPWATVSTFGGGFAEAGLLGIAVDPAFLSNGYVYVYHTIAGGGENVIARLQEVGGVGTDYTVLTPPGAISSQLYHNAGPLAFGQDGFLYCAVGDALGAANAQNTSNWNGKILRFEVPNLTVPASNLFGNPVFSYGHRNMFGLSVHPVTGDIYITENGGTLMDEVNHVVNGGNYGWPIHEGVEQPQDPSLEDPLAFYQPTTAPTGCCFYAGDHYPGAFKHAWFFADYNEGKIRILWLDAAGSSVVAQDVFDQHPGSGYGLVSGPDGNLWFLTNDAGEFGGDELGRYVHSAESPKSLQMSSVSNKSIGGSLTICIRGQNGEIAVPWMSLTRLQTPLPTVLGNLWVPGDAILQALPIVSDDRVYLGLPVPNAPAFIGTSLHTQGVVLDAQQQLTLTNPSELVLRG